MDIDLLERKFENVYKTEIEPKLKSIENYRIKKLKIYSFLERMSCLLTLLLAISFLLIFTVGLIIMIVNSELMNKLVTFVIFFFIIAFPIFISCSNISDKYRKMLKDSILIPILSIFGLKMVKDEVITLEDIKKLGVYPSATDKSDDDRVIGIYEKLPVTILESEITHHTGKSDVTTDFEGLILKVKFNKKINAHVVACQKGTIKLPNFEKIILEDVKFNKKFKIYSNNQVEARYLITTAFMERILNIEEVFNATALDFAFKGEYFYLFLHGSVSNDQLANQEEWSEDTFYLSTHGFFEVGHIKLSAMNKKIYKRVFNELISIFSLVDYFKLNQRIGI